VRLRRNDHRRIIDCFADLEAGNVERRQRPSTTNRGPQRLVNLRKFCGGQTSSEADAFSCENQGMRKRIINPTETSAPTTSEEWLDLEEIARVEVTSEDPQHLIESAFKHGESLGWRASQPGEQTIRLLFDEPKDLRRVWLRFREPKVERTQHFTLRWADDQTGPLREIVRQQWNFNPRSSTMEVEDYKVDLRHVLALELTIDPDLGKNQAFATLAEWRMA
jgi:hypothetical protein